jgi:hypothetical protein
MSDWHGYWCLSPVKERARVRGTDLLQQRVFSFQAFRLPSRHFDAITLFHSFPTVTSSFFELVALFYSWQKGYDSHFVTLGARARTRTFKLFIYWKQGNKMKVGKFAHHVCLRLPKGECLNTFLITPLCVFPVLFQSKRVDVSDRTRRHICIYCKAVRSRWSTTLVKINS